MTTSDDIKGMLDESHVLSLVRHTSDVMNAALILNEKIGGGQVDLLRRAIKHDHSKVFFQDEWKNLRSGKEKLKCFQDAVHSHHRRNDHHPEHWGERYGSMMPDAAIAEMVCDWYARSCEHGTDFKEWIEKGCQKRFKFPKEMHHKIRYYAYLLIEPEMGYKGK